MEDIRIDRWAVVAHASGIYLGQVASIEADAPTSDEKKRIKTDADMGVTIPLFPAFFFAVRLANTPQGMQRAVVVAPLDVTTHPVPVLVKATSVYLCADMAESDKVAYRQLVETGYDALVQTRAQQAGIVTPGAR